MTQVLSKLSIPNNVVAGVKVNRIAVASSAAALLYWAYITFGKQPKSKGRKVLFLDSKATGKKAKRKVDFGATLRQLSVILKSIMQFQDVALCCGITLGLILRTLLDLWNIQISTKVESAIITANPELLKQTLISFGVTMPTLAFVNNIIKFFTDKLSLRLRYNLSKSLYQKYMTDLTFYHLASSTNGDFQNVDQLLTSDVDKFCSSIVEVYNNLSKPILDIFLLVHRMSTGYTGGSTPAIMMGWLAFVGTILTQARKPLTGYVIRETQSEGQLRFVHSRLIQNSEEVAFYRGNDKENHTLMSALDNLKDSLDDLILFKFKIGFVDNIVGRYSSTIVGYLALALPFFSARYTSASNEERLTRYYVSGRMMMKLAESITRVIMAGQDLSKLAAYTQRVQSLHNSMDAHYEKTKQDLNYQGKIKVTGGSSSGGGGGGDGDDNDQNAEMTGPVVEICDRNNPVIDFQNVTLSTPQGDVLVKDLTFTIKPRQSVIIAGPNGSGKSSLFRVLGNLWRIESGRLVRPETDQLFYICQKPYMTLGTLRDQIIFPHTKSKMDDRELRKILDLVELCHIVDRENSFDSIRDWHDLLSGGEKQKMALARLIYHKPQFAILDECTSAVQIDAEQRIYKYLSEELNCTLLSVSHRVKQLAKFHHLILELDGNGSYTFKRIVAPLE